MIRASLALMAILAAGPAMAVDMALAKGAELRILDKLTGQLTNTDIAVGQSTSVGKLTVRLDECRYPADNKTAEAEARLTIVDSGVSTPVFNGWMIASSPALSALDHPRYDVWVMRCDVPDFDLPAVEPAPEEDQPEGGSATDEGAGQ